MCNVREECANELHFGRPVSMCNATTIEKVELVFRDDRKQSPRNIADNTSINRRTVFLHVTEDLSMIKVSAKTVSKILTSDKNLTRVRICEDRLENWDNFDKVITKHESWIFE